MNDPLINPFIEFIVTFCMKNDYLEQDCPIRLFVFKFSLKANLKYRVPPLCVNKGKALLICRSKIRSEVEALEGYELKIFLGDKGRYYFYFNLT